MNDLTDYGVYCILTPTGKAYVGMTTISFTDRWFGHMKELKNGRHKTFGLKNAYSKYGIESFTFTILEKWDKNTHKQEIIQEILAREKYWWEQLKSEGLTMLHGCPTGTGSVHHTDKTKERIRNKNLSLRNNNERFSFSKNDEDLIKKDYEDGLSIKTIAKTRNKSVKMLSTFIKVKGFQRLKKNRSTIEPFSKLKKDFPDVSYWHFHKGLSAIEIASQVGVSSSYISSFLRYEKELNPKLSSKLANDNNKIKAANALRNLEKTTCSLCQKDFSPMVIKAHFRACSSS